MEGECSQVFIHYRQTKDVNEEDKFDKRLGLVCLILLEKINS